MTSWLALLKGDHHCPLHSNRLFRETDYSVNTFSKSKVTFRHKSNADIIIHVIFSKNELKTSGAQLQQEIFTRKYIGKQERSYRRF